MAFSQKQFTFAEVYYHICLNNRNVCFFKNVCDKSHMVEGICTSLRPCCHNESLDIIDEEHEQISESLSDTLKNHSLNILIKL